MAYTLIYLCYGLKSSTTEKLIFVTQTLIKWRLSEVMARHRVKGVDLAERLQMTPTAVSKLKNAKTMPRIDGDKLNALCNALNELAEDTEDPKARTVITPAMLLEYVRDEQ
jgi:DNA-binding Xre family transcriptional regulator